MADPEPDKQWFQQWFQQRLERLQREMEIQRDGELRNPVLRENLMSLWHKVVELPEGAERQEFIDAIIKAFVDAGLIRSATEHAFAQFVTQEQESAAPISLYFDLDSLTPTDIADIIVFLSELYEDLGGDGLVIDDMTLLDFQPASVPVER